MKSSHLSLLIASAAALFLCGTESEAQNPISPMGIYIADPSARVAPDGRLYLYGSKDEAPDHYCSNRYDVLSSSDLKNWRLDRNALQWSTIVYAPDAAYKDGKTLLYFEDPAGNEFVAEGDTPYGPFKDAQIIEGPKQIDPAVFIDDDGQAYYFYGQFVAKASKMNPDLKTLDWSTHTTGFADEANHGFHEGIYVFKRDKYYYLVYADISRNHRPTCIGYSMATSPLGPYTYKGVIVDNAGCDPAVWNNHGSVIEYKGKWYVLYHRATHGCVAMRKACIEEIKFNEDGTIDEVEMTTQGAGKPLDAFKDLDAARACWMSGHVRIEGMPGNADREILSQIRGGDKAVWKYLNFKKKARSVTVRIKSATGGILKFTSDKPDGTCICTGKIEASPDWQTVTIPVIGRVKGVHALWASFEASGQTSSDQDIFQLDAIRFSRRK